MVYSEAQKAVFALYRSIFRCARTKEPGVRKGIEKYCRASFRENIGTLKRTDFFQIEFQMHRGQKFLKTIQKSDFSGISM